MSSAVSGLPSARPEALDPRRHEHGLVREAREVIVDDLDALRREQLARVDVRPPAVGLRAAEQLETAQAAELEARELGLQLGALGGREGQRLGRVEAPASQQLGRQLAHRRRGNRRRRRRRKRNRQRLPREGGAGGEEGEGEEEGETIQPIYCKRRGAFL
jgi:hypothetical protein